MRLGGLGFTMFTKRVHNDFSFLRKTVVWLPSFAVCLQALAYLPETTRYENFDASRQTEFLRVGQRDIALQVVNIKMPLAVGQRFDLFQQSRTHYVVVMPAPSGLHHLAAIPVKDAGGNDTAWVTNEKRVILGRATETCEGVFFLWRNELLPFLDDAPGAVRVVVERYGRQVVLDLPKPLDGLTREVRPPRKPPATVATRSPTVAATPPPTQKQPVAPPVIVRKPVVRVPPAVAAPAPAAPAPAAPAPLPTNATVARSTAPTPAPLSPPVREPVPAQPVTAPVATAGVTSAVPAAMVGRAPEPVPVPHLAVDPAAALTGGLAIVRAAPEGVPARVLPHVGPLVAAVVSNEAGLAGAVNPTVVKVGRPDTPARTGPLTHFFTRNALLFEFLLMVCAVEGALLVRLRRQQALTREVAGGVLSVETLGESQVLSGMDDQLAKGHELAGSLSQFSIMQILQLLYAAEESGVLWVSFADGSRLHKLLFDKGQLIDAEFGDMRGMAVLKRVMSNTKGSFTFKRETMDGHARIFKQDTMSLILGAAQMIDEGHATVKA